MLAYAHLLHERMQIREPPPSEGGSPLANAVFFKVILTCQQSGIGRRTLPLLESREAGTSPACLAAQ